jgi:hypothetical protein
LRKSRKDNNHNNIVKALTALFIPFCDLSAVGGGVPDGVIWHHSAWQFVEFKNREFSYGKKGLNQNQLDWLSRFPGAKVYIIESVDDVIAIANNKLDTLKHVTCT